MATAKIISIGERSSFEGDDKSEVAKQPMMIELSGPIRVVAYGGNVEVFDALKLTEGDEIMIGFRKAPSVQLS